MSRPVVVFVLLLLVALAAAAIYYFTIPPPGVLIVRTTPSGAEVWIDGDLRGTTPDTGLVITFSEAGSHHILLERKGYVQDTSTGVLGLDEVLELDLVLKVPGMAFIRGGEFEMGNAVGDYNERPARRVTLDPFYLDLKEVSVGEFRRFKPSYRPAFTGDGMPAANITWEEAKAYCNSKGKRLPTEAEWERACKGVEADIYSYGKTYDPERGRTGLTLRERSAPVGSYKPGNAGLFDMSGNVWEWCSDWYGRDYYKEGENRNPKGPAKGQQHVLRGGAWFSNAHYARCTHRPGNIGKKRDPSFGFRCARDFEQGR